MSPEEAAAAAFDYGLGWLACVCLRNQNRFATNARVSSFMGLTVRSPRLSRPHAVTSPVCSFHALHLNTGHSVLLLMGHFFPVGCTTFTAPDCCLDFSPYCKNTLNFRLEFFQFQEPGNKSHTLRCSTLFLMQPLSEQIKNWICFYYIPV